MAEDKVLIKYTNAALVNKFSSKPIPTNKSHAESMQAKGWAVIISAPVPHPTLLQEELDEIKKKYETDVVLYTSEEKFLTKITWITCNFVDLDIRKAGVSCGFRTTLVGPSNLTAGKLIMSDLVILNSNLTGFNDVQIVQIKSVLFQKSVPYVYLIENDVFDTERGIHFLMDSKLNIFKNEEIFDIAIEKMGELISENWLIMDGDNYTFWKKLNGVVA